LILLQQKNNVGGLVLVHIGTYQAQQSYICSALDPAKRNPRLSPLGGEMAPTYLGGSMYIRSKYPSVLNPDLVDGDPNVKCRMVTIDPEELIGRTLLKDAEEDGQRFQARVV
jgi:hypothetical protein